MRKTGLWLLLAMGLVGTTGWRAEDTAVVGPVGMIRAAADLASIGAITFSPEGILFVGDSYGSQVVALDLEETESVGAVTDVADLDARVASLLGTAVDQVRIHDLAVSPISGAAYLSVSRGDPTSDLRIRSRPRVGASPHLIRIPPEGPMEEVPLDDVLVSRAKLSDVRPAETDRRGWDRRAWNLLDMAFADGTLYVSGMSNEEWSSKLRRIAYPFDVEAQSNALRIFHTAHGRYETSAPARVFVPYQSDGEIRVFAGFSCTPLVDFSLAEMNEHERVEGRTIAELGPGNHVLDMIRVERDGQTHFLLANHLHPFMRLSLSDFEDAAVLTRPTSRAGIDRSPLGPDGVFRLANDRDERVLLLQEKDDDGVDLRVVAIDRLLD
jgi:hypothetical protein